MLDPITLAEKGLIPDTLIRRGIRRQLQERLEQEGRDDLNASERRRREFRQALRQSEIAVNTDDANSQHYEVPAGLFELMLGRRLKYSSCWWDDNCNSLDQSEDAMLAMYVQRAQLQDGQRILELGCGWGLGSIYWHMVSKLALATLEPALRAHDDGADGDDDADDDADDAVHWRIDGYRRWALSREPGLAGSPIACQAINRGRIDCRPVHLYRRPLPERPDGPSGAHLGP